MTLILWGGSWQKGVLWAAQADKPGIGTLKFTANTAILMEVGSGEILFEKNAYTERPPASTTKILTTLLALELGEPGELVKVSAKAAGVGQSTIFLDPGEELTLYELITGALVRSGNDACVAIAEEISGSETDFVRLMNRKAKLLGAQHTHFVNTNGLPHPDHYTCAYDLAVIARYALQNPVFASITRQKETTLHFLQPETISTVKNTNRLLWNYSYADGVKTGTTTAAGKCLIASATKDGRQLLAVLLNAPDRFGDAERLLEWGFSTMAVQSPIE
jgi:D-alanyl-D-alanine carboxypeptidase (penicillin-binding protein 5/6)